MRNVRTILPCLAALLVLFGCENDVPAPEPVAPKATTASTEPAAPPSGQPETANCCGAEMCKRVPGGCGCRKGGNKNANCGG